MASVDGVHGIFIAVDFLERVLPRLFERDDCVGPSGVQGTSSGQVSDVLLGTKWACVNMFSGSNIIR